MRSYKYIPYRKLRRMYKRRFSWMRLAEKLVPAVMWWTGMGMLMIAVMVMVLKI